jgi:hypothetical protein
MPRPGPSGAVKHPSSVLNSSLVMSPEGGSSRWVELSLVAVNAGLEVIQCSNSAFAGPSSAALLCPVTGIPEASAIAHSLLARALRRYLG